MTKKNTIKLLFGLGQAINSPNFASNFASKLLQSTSRPVWYAVTPKPSHVFLRPATRIGSAFGPWSTQTHLMCGHILTQTRPITCTYPGKPADNKNPWATEQSNPQSLKTKQLPEDTQENQKTSKLDTEFLPQNTQEHENTTRPEAELDTENTKEVEVEVELDIENTEQLKKHFKKKTQCDPKTQKKMQIKKYLKKTAQYRQKQQNKIIKKYFNSNLANVLIASKTPNPEIYEILTKEIHSNGLANALITSKNTPKASLIYEILTQALILNAQNSIDIYAYMFRNQKLMHYLIDAANRNPNLQIRITINIHEESHLKVLLEKLGCGLPENIVVTLTKKPIHAKSIVFDKKTSLIGSKNFTNSNNPEHTAILRLNDKAKEGFKIENQQSTTISKMQIKTPPLKTIKEILATKLTAYQVYQIALRISNKKSPQSQNLKKEIIEKILQMIIKKNQAIKKISKKQITEEAADLIKNRLLEEILVLEKAIYLISN